MLLNADKERSKSALNRLTVINQSMEPKAIKASFILFKRIDDLFTALLPIIDALGMTPQTCEYYAVWLKKAKLSQLKQFPNQNKLYLHLIAFIQHQFYLRQDAFADILLKCVQSSQNTALKRLDTPSSPTRNEQCAAIQQLKKSRQNDRELIDEITLIVRSSLLSDQEKVEKINELLVTQETQKNEVEQKKIAKIEKTLDRLSHKNDYFDILDKLSVKLQQRVSGIIKILVFNKDNSNKKIIDAIDFFKSREGRINNKAPLDFLKESEKKLVVSEKARWSSSLYKSLLFIKIAQALKSGELNLKYSYRYLSIQDYLVDEKTWRSNKCELLALTGLESFAECATILHSLKQRLHEKYMAVNQRFLTGRNLYLSFHKEKQPHVVTPALDDKEMEYISALLNQCGYVPILDVLTEINAVTQFTSCFQHHSIKNSKRRPRAEIFYAGIMALGCNIGVSKMGQISMGVNQNSLLNTVNWYFNKKNLQEANDRLVALIHKLVLSTAFISNNIELHSSSDGRKVNVDVESLLASYSFKYFGKEKGVSVYTFIDERQALFHSLVMSAAEREAAYVMDGLNDNTVAKTNIHSTDTHGYTESIFAATHFMGISFAPRIKKISKQKLYAFQSKKTYEKQGCKILPSRTINQTLIEKYWDDILRFMVTIKLKKITASQLFKRLSSYAKDNPLYKALKEFGRIIKSLFILSYYDDVKLRQRIEKQLNRIELSNRFANAVFYANNREFKQGTPEEQEIIIACKVFIQNAIVLWNYLYLSQLLANCQDDKERHEMASHIKEGSIINWGHINLHGEFDFRRHATNDPLFDMEKILGLQLA